MSSSGPGARDEAMTKHRLRECFDIVGNRVVAAGRAGVCLHGPVESQRGARAGSQRQFRVLARFTDQVEYVFRDVRFNADGTDVFLQCDDIGRLEYRFEFFDRFATPVLGENGSLGFTVGVTHLHAEQETVELTFRQWVGALKLVWVLGSDDQKWRPERSGVAV